MNQLHVVEKSNSITPAYAGATIWKTGEWPMALDTAERFCGGEFHAHEKQVSPSHFSGDIVDFEYCHATGRATFLVRRRVELDGNVTGRKGWARWRKFVWDTGAAASAAGRRFSVSHSSAQFR